MYTYILYTYRIYKRQTIKVSFELAKDEQTATTTHKCINVMERCARVRRGGVKALYIHKIKSYRVATKLLRAVLVLNEYQRATFDFNTRSVRCIFWLFDIRIGRFLKRKTFINAHPNVIYIYIN